MSHAPTLWPQVLVEAGPGVAGVAAGTAIAFAPGEPVHARVDYWQGGRPTLVIEPRALNHSGPEPAWRVLAEPPRLESYEMRAGASASAWGPARSDEAVLGPWRVRFLIDGPALAVPKRFGMYMGVHPRVLSFTGERAFSEWIIPSEGASSVFFIEESEDGTTYWMHEPRRSGVLLADLRVLADAPIDAEVAAGIVAQMSETQPRTRVGFDGIVRAMNGARDWRREGRIVDVYAALTGATGERALIEEELRATRRASPAEIANVVRHLAPDAWARERALVEECGVFEELP